MTWGILELNEDDPVWFGTAPDQQQAIEKYCRLAAAREDGPIEIQQEQLGDLQQWATQLPDSITYRSDIWTLVIFKMDEISV